MVCGYCFCVCSKILRSACVCQAQSLQKDIYLIEKMLLKSIKHERWGFKDLWVCSLAKQIQSYLGISLHCQDLLLRMQIPRVLCLRHVVESFLTSKKAYDFKALSKQMQLCWPTTPNIVRPFAHRCVFLLLDVVA